MPITAADWSVDEATGNVRYIGDDHGGGTPSYATVIEFHRWLADLADDATFSGDDELDITKLNPSDRSTDNIITLVNNYNIDDNAAEHLYDGSIIQSGGNEIYDGIVNFGNTPDIQIIQNGVVLADDWWNSGGGLNADAAAGISHRFMIKVRTGAADIDGRRLIGMSRNFTKTYSEFSINGTSRGNNVLALSEQDDLNNATADATVAGWTDVVNDTEGYVGIDADGDTTNEFYYSDWELGTRTKNQFYERLKWLTQTPRVEDSNADTGSDFTVDDATITGAAQSFAVGGNAIVVQKITVNLKANGSPTGNMTAAIYTHSGVFGTSSTPNVIVGAVSETFDTSLLDTAYRPVTFNFAAPISLSASTNYVLVLEHANGGASDFVQVQGLATSGTHGGNRSHNTAGWTAVAADDLNFTVYGAIGMYGIPGTLFRGITHELDVDTPTGTFNAFEQVSWAGGTGQMLAINSPTAATKMWIQLLTGVVPTDGQTITGATSSATVDLNVTVTARTLSTPFVGASTGSAIIGAYGLGVGADDLGASDIVTDLTNTVRNPPNNVTFTVQGLVSGEDRVLVGPESGGVLQTAQFTLQTALTTDNITSVQINTTIPSDTPSTGHIRVQDDNGLFRRLHYSSYATDTFTIDTTDGNEDFATVNASASNEVFISYIDKLAGAASENFTGVYSSDRALFIRVRDGDSTPIKPFETTGTLGSAGGSATVIRTSDE